MCQSNLFLDSDWGLVLSWALHIKLGVVISSRTLVFCNYFRQLHKTDFDMYPFWAGTHSIWSNGRSYLNLSDLFSISKFIQLTATLFLECPSAHLLDFYTLFKSPFQTPNWLTQKKQQRCINFFMSRYRIA